MYIITIITPKGVFEEKINNMVNIDKTLALYPDYTSMSATFQSGEIQEEQKEKKENMSKYDTTVRITDFNIDWKKIKSGCMTTISKEAGDKEPSDEWKRKLLLCEHSPIRRGEVSWKWEAIPYAISTHFARHHEGCEKFIATERTDRTGIPREERSQMNPVMMEMDANIQALINISAKRLCTGADPLTIKYWKAVLEEIKKYDKNIYWACVPQCVRCGGCPEYTNCGFYENLMKDQPMDVQMSLVKRYNLYNEKRR